MNPGLYPTQVMEWFSDLWQGGQDFYEILSRTTAQLDDKGDELRSALSDLQPFLGSRGEQLVLLGKETERWANLMRSRAAHAASGS
jgi:hypothetical protein